MNLKSTYIPKSKAILSAKEFNDIVRVPSKSSNIKKVEFIRPQLGSTDYGAFEITYKTPVLIRSG